MVRGQFGIVFEHRTPNLVHRTPAPLVSLSLCLGVSRLLAPYASRLTCESGPWSFVKEKSMLAAVPTPHEHGVGRMSLKVTCVGWKVCPVGYPSPIGIRKRTTCGQRIFSCEQARFLCGYPVEYRPALDYPLGFRIPQSFNPNIAVQPPRHQDTKERQPKNALLRWTDHPGPTCTEPSWPAPWNSLSQQAGGVLVTLWLNVRV